MATRKKTDQVLAAARKDLQRQLLLVRDELSRLVAEESALTSVLSSLNGSSTSSSSAASASKSGAQTRTTKSSARRSSTRKSSTAKRRRPRGASKSTADRVKEVQGLLADGAKSRNDLAAALKVSPARVQQLLAELGSSVSSQAAPGRQGKLWSLKAGSGNGASAAKTAPKPASAKAKRSSARKPAAAKAAAAK